MAIFKPGQSFRYHNILKRKGNKRPVIAILSLTAMVDMFTVLVIFLLQNYNTTGEILHLPKEVVLPKANRVVELKPSLVITISSKEILIDKLHIASFDEVKKSENWVIPKLRDKAKVILEKAKADQEAKLQNKFEKVVGATIGDETKDPNAWKKVTILADKSIDYLTLKKIMYTIYEAGGGPINFAVSKEFNKANETSNSENK